MTNLTDEQRAARKAYHKQWRENNRDKVQKHTSTFFEKKALEARQGEATQ